MAKKRYIKDSRGMTVSVTTDTLGLEKPLLNENYDIDVHNRNMDKIDEDLKPIDDSYIIELFQHDGDTTSPNSSYTKEESDARFALKSEVDTLQHSVNENKTNILNLQEEVNGQRLRGVNILNNIYDKLGVD